MQKPKTQKTSHKFNQLFKRTTVLVVTAVIVAAGVMQTHRLVLADAFQDQINALSAQNSNTQGAVNQLGAEAANYQDAIAKLQAQINNLQTQITANQNHIAQLQAQIIQAEEDLAKQKNLLGENIRAMYVEGEISTFEMLASSKDLSEFVDKQQYRNSVKTKIKLTLDKINDLKAQLKSQKQELELSTKNLLDMQNQVVVQKGEQNRLLGMNQSQQADLNNQIRQTNAEIASLKAQQLAANRRLGGNATAGDPNKGGYPAKWANAPIDSMLDSWGMYNRECVSYTAWKVYQRYGYMPYWGGRGNANQWPSSARTDGIPTGSTPRLHSVAISMNGYYGHAMWVEAVNSNGTILVSQYNYSAPGQYSEMTINGGGLTYIYFGN